MVHSNDNARDAIEEILYNFNMLRRNFLTNMSRFGQTETIPEHMRPSDIATILPSDPVLERDVSEIECDSIGSAGCPEYLFRSFCLQTCVKLDTRGVRLRICCSFLDGQFIEEFHSMDWKGCNVFPI